MIRALAGALPGIVALLLACDSVQIYRAEGRVVSVDAAAQKVEVAHEEIKGLMPAMVMQFEVARPELLDGVEAGQVVRFELERRGAKLRILALETLDVGDTSGGGLSGLSGGGQDLVPAPAPDFELIDQDGRQVSLRALRGKALLVDFIYTSCPGPCPIQTSLHASLQRSLSPELAARAHFVSITLDPRNDTPAAMKTYALARGADLENWSFLTGDEDVVRRIAQAYHVAPSDAPASSRQRTGPIDHIMARYLIGPDGRIARLYIGVEHLEAELLKDLTEILG